MSLRSLRTFKNVEKFTDKHRKELNKSDEKGNSRMSKLFRVTQSILHHIEPRSAGINAPQVKHQRSKKQTHLKRCVIEKFSGYTRKKIEAVAKEHLNSEYH